jgi:hypothetical protein
VKIVFGFLLGFAAGFWGFVAYTSKNSSSKVLALQIEATPSVTSTPSPTPTSTPNPTIKPASTRGDKSTRGGPTLTPEPASRQGGPTPVGPTTTPDVWSPPALEPLFAQYAGQYGIDKNALERIANCESHFNSNSVNGDYVGMFQFSTKTWADNRTKMGADPNPALRTNPEESIKTGAFLISKRGIDPWPACMR